MSQWNESRGFSLGALSVAVVALGVSVAGFACRAQTDEKGAASERVTPVATGERVSSVASVAATPAATAVPAAAATTEARAGGAETAVLSNVARAGVSSADAKPSASGLAVKRFVVTTGIEQREPLASSGPEVADGKPVYAFAELVNRGDSEQQLTVTFERMGSSERVGFATLKVPANVPRHRTWANTRFIREPGMWEAVLWNGDLELARTGFSVVAP